MELISVIIPAYNAAKYLKETLDSVLNQSYEEREIIVVNDGSTDNTTEILSGFKDKIIIINQKNRGDAAACNAGVSIARGRWVSFIDADDLWLPDKLSCQLAYCCGKPISYTDSFVFGEAIVGNIRRSSFEPPYSGYVLKELLIRNFITKSTVMVRRDIFIKYGGFDETYVLNDWPLWLKICSDNQIGYVPEPLARYRVHHNSATAKARQRLPEHLRLIAEVFGPNGVGKLYPQLRSKALASSYAINCHFSARSSDWPFAVYCALQALRYEPTVLSNWKNLAKSALIPLGFQH